MSLAHATERLRFPLRVIAGIALLYAGVLLLAMLFANLPGSLRPASPRQQCKGNLHAIATALHLYHSAYGSFPPAHVADVDGNPMHSWRVLVLPFVAQANSTKHSGLNKVYDTYKFDEPWDGQNNRTLIDQIPEVYHCPDQRRKDASCTSYVAVVGAETAWPGAETVSIDDIRDGLSKTILLVEVSNSGIQWTQPEDLHFDQIDLAVNSRSGVGIGSPHVGGANIVLGDGTVRFMIDDVQSKTIKALLTIAGGEPIRDEDF